MPPSARSKSLPNLSEYLHKRGLQFPVPGLGFTANLGGWLAMVAGGGGAFIFLDQRLGWSWIPSAAVAFFAVGMPLSAAISTAIRKHMTDKARSERKREATIHDGHAKLFQALTEGKLHRNLDAASAALLEESSRNWMRIQAAVDSPAWDATDSAQWLALRTQVSGAANEAMDDIFYLLQATFRPQTKKDNWEGTFRDVLEDWFGVEAPMQKPEFLTPEYTAARQTAQKLLQLANQIDEIVRNRLTDTRQLESSQNHSHLDFVLRELRDIHEAEQELRHQDV